MPWWAIFYSHCLTFPVRRICTLRLSFQWVMVLLLKSLNDLGWFLISCFDIIWLFLRRSFFICRAYRFVFLQYRAILWDHWWCFLLLRDRHRWRFWFWGSFICWWGKVWFLVDFCWRVNNSGGFPYWVFVFWCRSIKIKWWVWFTGWCLFWGVWGDWTCRCCLIPKWWLSFPAMTVMVQWYAILMPTTRCWCSAFTDTLVVKIGWRLEIDIVISFGRMILRKTLLDVIFICEEKFQILQSLNFTLF